MSTNGDGAAEVAGEVVEAVVEGVAANAEAAIENAERRAEAAEETAEQIAEAALRDRLGRMVTEATEDFRTWREETNQRLLSLDERVTAAVSTMEAALSELRSQSSPPVMAAPSTPQAPSEPILSPGDVADGPRESPDAPSSEPAQPPKRRRFAL